MVFLQQFLRSRRSAAKLTIGTLIELVAVLLVGVELESVGLGTGGILGLGGGNQHDEEETKWLHGDSAKSTAGLHIAVCARCC